MLLIFLFLTILFNVTKQQNLPSVKLDDDNLDDTITQVFNKCKCVIFYLCDEDNFIIPSDQLKFIKSP